MNWKNKRLNGAIGLTACTWEDYGGSAYVIMKDCLPKGDAYCMGILQ